MTQLPFRLLIITDWALGEALLPRLELALQAGPGIAVQHRHPGALGRQFFDEGAQLAELCARHGAPLFVNARLDVALALGAHLHLPTHGLRVADVRPHLPGKLISLAVHSAEESQAGADLALLSPVFTPGSKPNDSRPVLGADGFRTLAAQLELPAVALGGISVETAPRLGPGTPMAVISGVLHAQNPRSAARTLLAL